MNTQFNCNGNPILFRAESIEYDDHSRTEEVLLFIYDGLIFEYPHIERDLFDKEIGLENLDYVSFFCDVIPVRAADFISGVEHVDPDVSDAFFEWFQHRNKETVTRFSELYYKWVDSLY